MANQVDILSPGFLTTIQDLGREGYERFGVPVGGAMDSFALMAANALAGNPPGATGLEFTLEGPALRLGADSLLAAAGCGFELAVGGRRMPLWMAAWARRGEVVELISTGRGGWGYLAVYGGIAVAPVLGSRATYLRGGLGGLEGRVLRAGDVLEVGDLNAYSHYKLTGTKNPAAQNEKTGSSPRQITPGGGGGGGGGGGAWQPLSPGQLYNRAGLSLPAARRPPYAERPMIEVILGPQLAEGGLANVGRASVPDDMGRDQPGGTGGPPYETPGAGKRRAGILPADMERDQPGGRATARPPYAGDPVGRASMPDASGRAQPGERGGPPYENPAPVFSRAGLAAFLESSYTLTPACDRMGYRLAGPKIELRAAGELLSEGIPLGAVQVPGDGQPIVLLADRQATGGYAKIAVVTRAALPLLVQTPIGSAVRFQAVSLKTAQEKWRKLTANLHEFLI